MKNKTYFKYSFSLETEELAKISFTWLPTLNIWHHICFVKTFDYEYGGRLDFFVDGINVGNSKQLIVENL